MAVWSSAAVGSMAASINAFATGGAMIRFNDSAGAQVGTYAVCSATFSDVSATGMISCRAITNVTATASYTLGTAILYTPATATIATFTCTSAGATDFVFGGLNVATNDSIVINTWTITVQTA
jgi:hypothetical protein